MYLTRVKYKVFFIAIFFYCQILVDEVCTFCHVCTSYTKNIFSNLRVLSIKQILAHINIPHNFLVDAYLRSHSF